MPSRSISKLASKVATSAPRDESRAPGRECFAPEAVEQELPPGVRGDSQQGGIEPVVGNSGVAEHRQRALAEPLHLGTLEHAGNGGEQSRIAGGRAADVGGELQEPLIPRGRPGRTGNLCERRVSHQAQQLGLALDVVVGRCHGDAELVGEDPHRHPFDSDPFGDEERGVDDLLAGDEASRDLGRAYRPVPDPVRLVVQGFGHRSSP